MRRLVFALALAGTLAGCTRPGVPPPAAPDAGPTPAAQVAELQPTLGPDELPAREPERGLVLGQCQICHTAEYVKQQRLTPAQWTATVNKMIGWGAPITPEQGSALAKALAEAYPPDLGDYRPPLVETPGASP